MPGFRNLPPRSRRQIAIANAALVVGLLLWLFVHPARPAAHSARDAAAGFLLGLSITVNLFIMWKARRAGTSC